MASTIRFSGISKSDGSKVFCIEPDWWDDAEFQSSTNFHWIETNETGSYVDRDVDISADEAQKLHDHFRQKLVEKIAYNMRCRDAEKLRTDQYASKRLADYALYAELLQTNLDSIDSALGVNAADFSHFHLTISQWESGY